MSDPLATQREFDLAAAGASERVDGGWILTTPEYSASWELNKVLLEPGADAAAVAAAVRLADLHFDGWGHRRVSVPLPAEPVAAPAGWESEELLLMVWPGAPPRRPAAVRDITADELFAARLADGAPEELCRIQAPFDRSPGARPLALFEDDGIAAWCVVHGGAIDDVWVPESRRGRGLGRLITTAAVAAGGWFLLCDVDDPRPQGLYRSMGFEDAGRMVNLTRRYVAAP